MEFLGVRWAPLNTPLKRRLQTLSVVGWFVLLVFGPVFGYGAIVYMIFYTSYWWLAIAYMVFIYYDDACYSGYRWTNWVRNWAWWRYMAEYFPHSMVKTADLDPKRNYLFCIYPHGVLSTGVFSALCTNALDVDKVFPHHKTHLLSLHQHFQAPFSREVGLMLGALSAAPEAINATLSTPGGGHVVGLVVGGAAEALMSRPNMYRILINKRKGFCRLALKHGSPLVPVFSFGEHVVYDQVSSEQDSLFYRCQELLRKYIGMAPVIIRGRGMFQYSFGLLPHRSPVTVVVGEPLEVEKNINPTKEDIEALHARFCVELRALYDKHKHKYNGGVDVPLVFE
ncbi:2-acylglycerol O-acyltransferase 2-like [Thrips palmi]|uniref:Acyltransferase n=1 Tax=Thrips palmi TaxID=161013 RepID=A0A6P9AB60_THRPL|nr:2-acylglycerol O-acyltransferase 2-like [Thrips palmi]XP_034254724.1 2-acylglycerol O-acyltransferase 2-like [Thrips palmi]